MAIDLTNYKLDPALVAAAEKARKPSFIKKIIERPDRPHAAAQTLCPFFAESFLNREGGHTCLGRKLLPFSVWHMFLLRHDKSPVLVPGARCEIFDIINAVSTCQTTYPHTPRLPRFLFLRTFLHARHLPAECSKFSAYVNDYLAPPQIIPKGGDDGSGVTEVAKPMPAELSLVASLLLTGFTEQEAWDMPVGKAHWYCVARAVIQGGAEIEFIDESDEDSIFNRIRRIRAEAAAKANATPPEPKPQV